ncbi:hypothetical protein DH2020_036622 [Rehmannia glutinosa]|uniref:Uncharacterized protein n=1 Tax=Rehmannia glutinosa TaxID=99300 RepID=A0ABR0V3N1_REHGL
MGLFLRLCLVVRLIDEESQKGGDLSTLSTSGIETKLTTTMARPTSSRQLITSPSTTPATATATTTVTLETASSSQQQPQITDALVLKLKLPKKKVSWKEGTVDNEFMNKKSSKKCCIFHKEKPFDEDDSDAEGDCDHDHHNSGRDIDDKNKDHDEGDGNCCQD